MNPQSISNTNSGHGLVLQGGGALGSFELGVARAIYSEPCRFRPGVIAGVSIGAISAVLLGRPAKNYSPLEALEAFWREVTVSQVLPSPVQPYLSVLGTPHFYSFDPLWMFGTSFYSVAPLRKTLEALVDVERLADPSVLPRLVFTATDIESGQLETFQSDGPLALTLDHVLASGSLPPSFPMTKIGERHYWDGGVFDNTPLGAVIDMLEGEAANRAIAVVNLFPNKMPIPQSLADVGQHFLNLLFVNKTRSDLALMGKFNAVADLMDALKELPGDSPVKALPSFKTMMDGKAYRRVPAIVDITRESPAQSMEASDFSHAGIERRAAEGFKNAKAKLSDKGFL